MDDISLGHSSEAPRQKPLLSRELRFPFVREIERLLLTFSPFERLVLYALSILLVASTAQLLLAASASAVTTTPTEGGTLVEGAIGNPRFVNPLLAISQVDQDLTSLVYSGLMRNSDGSLVPDLAEEYTVSDDGTVYTFTLRNTTFHDGTRVTADDVAFTISLAQNADVRSPRRADWDGVVANVIDEKTISFTLPQAYAPFLENTTIGILPKHLWENVSPSEFPFFALNTSPVGSGPYKVEAVTEDENGLPVSLSLVPFEDFALGTPFLSNIEFHFYPNEEGLLAAFAEDEIESFAGLAPTHLPDDTADEMLVRIPSTRIFGVYLNQNHAPLLADEGVRAALSLAIDRDAIIAAVFEGYGTAIDSPIPPGFPLSRTPLAVNPEERAARIAAALKGWQLNEETKLWTNKDGGTISIALTTADTPELRATAEIVVEQWRAAGIDARIQVYPLSEFSATVLRPRQYDAVLFGQVVGRTLDLFAFWHSSQRNDPGLNLALYTNTKADRALASARTELSAKTREALYAEFVSILDEELPAIFLYAPEFTYMVPRELGELRFPTLSSPSERFLNVHRWYTDSEPVWDIFAR
jgi:peptide/nickel transport system substrate-binding protein